MLCIEGQNWKEEETESLFQNYYYYFVEKGMRLTLFEALQTWVGDPYLFVLSL